MWPGGGVLPWLRWPCKHQEAYSSEEAQEARARHELHCTIGSWHARVRGGNVIWLAGHLIGRRCTHYVLLFHWRCLCYAAIMPYHPHALCAWVASQPRRMFGALCRLPVDSGFLRPHEIICSASTRSMTSSHPSPSSTVRPGGRPSSQVDTSRSCARQRGQYRRRSWDDDDSMVRVQLQIRTFVRRQRIPVASTPFPTHSSCQWRHWRHHA